mgnify:CR=1 FL=1
MANYLHKREKKRRHLTPKDKCPMCIENAETTLHALRDYTKIKSIWRSLVFPHFWEDFFNKSTIDWLDRNQKQDGIGAGERVTWQLIFQLIVYHAWKVRNKFAIEGEECFLKISLSALRQMAEQAKKILINGRGRSPK